MIRFSTYIAHSASQGYALRFPSIGEGNYRPAYACAESNSELKIKADPYINITFKTERGVPLIADNENNTLTFNAGTTPTQAIYAYDDTTMMGKLCVQAYSYKEAKVHLVRIKNEASDNRKLDLEKIEKEVNEKWQQALVKYTFDELEPISIEYANGTNFVHGGKGTFQNYNADQKTAIRALPQTADGNDYYLFFVDCYDRLDTAGMVSNEIVSGYMPVGRHYGFIYNEFNNPRTIAHELGHGVNALHHTFSAESETFHATNGTSDNLMDYNGGTTLNHNQWQWSHETHRNVLGFLDDEGEGESKIAINEQILALLKSIRDANLNDEPSLSVSFTNMKYQLEVPRINFDLGKGQLRYLRLGDVNTENNLIGWLKSTAIIVPNETVETSYIKNDVKYARFTFKSATDSDKADIAFCIDVRDDEKDVLIDYLNPYKITTKQLKDIYPNATDERVKAVTEAINKYCNDFEINTPERMAHFLGQIGVEATANLDGLSENCSYSATNIKNIFAKRANSTRTIDNRKFKQLTNADLYDGMSKSNDYYFPIHNNIACYDTIYHFFSPKYDIATAEIYADLGINTYYTGGKNNCALFNYVYCCNKSNLGNGDYESGDGARFRGRGFIHLTGRSNYTTYLFNPWKKKYPDDKRTIEQIMDLLETDIDLAIKVSMVYWEANNINSYITNTTNFSNTNDEIRKVSGCVNVGNYKTNIEKINGYTERLNNTIKAYESLNKK